MDGNPFRVLLHQVVQQPLQTAHVVLAAHDLVDLGEDFALQPALRAHVVERRRVDGNRLIALAGAVVDVAQTQPPHHAQVRVLGARARSATEPTSPPGKTGPRRSPARSGPRTIRRRPDAQSSSAATPSGPRPSGVAPSSLPSCLSIRTASLSSGERSRAVRKSATAASKSRVRASTSALWYQVAALAGLAARAALNSSSAATSSPFLT